MAHSLAMLTLGKWITEEILELALEVLPRGYWKVRIYASAFEKPPIEKDGRNDIVDSCI